VHAPPTGVGAHPLGVQTPEQQSVATVQYFDEPLQHLPAALQRPPWQHCEACVQVSLGTPQHVKLSHKRGEQQSPKSLQVAPRVPQGEQWLVASQTRSPQQSKFELQVMSSATQHVPSTQPPPQHSLGLEHVDSPPLHVTCSQRPRLQASPEQQLVGWQLSPSVPHELEHRPLLQPSIAQQSFASVHPSPLDRHVAGPQAPSTQSPSQQSLPTSQPTPAERQRRSQTSSMHDPPLQHARSVRQCSPIGAHRQLPSVHANEQQSA